MSRKIPVILDTDIGGDIDDAWALAFLLRSPEIDLRLIITDTGNTAYRGAVAARLLEAANRTDIPIGVGIHQNNETGPQEPWLEGYTLSDYPGTVYKDGIAAMNDILSSSEQITLLCICPVPNVREALRRDAGIVQNVRIVGMFGSIRLGYDGSSIISKEYNVSADPEACRQLFDAFPSVTITPLDTCGLVRLTGSKYGKIHDCNDTLIKALIQSYYSWAEHNEWTEATPETSS